MKWDKDELRKKLDERAREQYMTSGSFASTPFGLDGIPFVRRDAIIDFIMSLEADESPIKEESQDELWKVVSKIIHSTHRMEDALGKLNCQFHITRKQ